MPFCSIFCAALLLAHAFPAPAADDALPLKGVVVVVDAGHGGQRYSKSYTGGTRGVVSHLTESELNLKVAFELEKLLKAAGATTRMTREADHRLSREGSSNSEELHARIDFLDVANPHFFLSVHHNAGAESATGHTALYKNNAKEDALYESLAKSVNDALEGAVPGPKRKLIRGDYHILRETDIPGTIAESGFMTNKAYDELCNRPEYPAKEAKAITDGAVKYWQQHREALTALREKLQKERQAKPRDPDTFTAIELNPAYQKKLKALLARIEPSGKYEAANAERYIEAFRKEVVGDAKVVFSLQARFDGKEFKLAGETSEKGYHDRLIDMFVAMKLYPAGNEVKILKK